MQDTTAPPDASTARTEAEWLNRIDEIGEELGYFQHLGKKHAAFFHDDGQAVLLVSFETAGAIRTHGPGQLPLGHDLARSHGWSSLCVIALEDSWYRDPAVWGYFDRLVDDAFFEDFDRVIFYGAGMGGYAAAAYSVAAPGATVIALNPQATLDPRLTEWDTRFARHRRLDFTSRYGFAPDMIEGADHVYLLYDPERGQDAMHAALFARPHVTRWRCPHLGARMEQDLLRMKILPELVSAAGKGTLDGQSFHRLYRRRRDYLPYLLRLLSRLENRGRHGLTALLARWSLQHLDHPRLRQAHDQANDQTLDRADDRVAPARPVARPGGTGGD